MSHSGNGQVQNDGSLKILTRWWLVGWLVGWLVPLKGLKVGVGVGVFCCVIGVYFEHAGTLHPLFFLQRGPPQVEQRAGHLPPGVGWGLLGLGLGDGLGSGTLGTGPGDGLPLPLQLLHLWILRQRGFLHVLQRGLQLPPPVGPGPGLGLG